MTQLEDIARQALSQCIDKIKDNATKAGYVVTGKTVKSLEAELVPEGEDLIARVLGRKYFGALETGSGPAQRRCSDAERKEHLRQITEWCMRKGIPSGGLTAEQYARVAARIRWYQIHFGTELYRKGGRKDIFTPPAQELEDQLTEALLIFYEKEITNKFTEGFGGFGRGFMDGKTK